MPHPKVVLLDAVGTVIQPFPSVAATYQEVGRLHGIELDQGSIRSRFHAAIKRFSVHAFQQSRNLADPFKTDEVSERLRWQAIVDYVLSPTPEQKCSVFESLWDHFARPENWRLFDDVLPTLNLLVERGFRLGLASNFDQRLRCIAELYFSDYPLELFVSSEVGWVKPAEQFYAEVTRRLGLSPNQILLIGDDWENDVKAPQKFGWQTVYLDRDGGPDGVGKSNGHNTLEDAVDRLFPN